MSPWEQIRVELSERQILFCCLVYRHPQQICEVMTVMHYLVKAVRGRITNCRHCPIITVSPEQCTRIKLAVQTFPHIEIEVKERHAGLQSLFIIVELQFVYG